MNKQITFKMWLSIFFGDIWQVIRKSFATILSWKNKTTFWRVIWASLTICVVFFTSGFRYIFYREMKGKLRKTLTRSRLSMTALGSTKPRNWLSGNRWRSCNYGNQDGSNNANRQLAISEMQNIFQIFDSFSQDCDVVWSVTDEDSLGDTIKVIFFINISE